METIFSEQIETILHDEIEDCEDKISYPNAETDDSDED